MPQLALAERPVGPWALKCVVFEGEDQSVVVPVISIVGNSVPTSARGKAVLASWKKAVAAAAKSARGPGPLNPRWCYAISAGFSFNLAEHGNRALDVENYLKPSFDALAAGLFCDNDQDPRQIERYDYDDSGFRFLFVYRLEDAPTRSDEGACFVVSILKSQG